jgi:hypothetical protein
MSSAAPFANGLRDDADWICIERGSLDALLKSLGPAATARGENDAVRVLASKLKENPDMTRAEAFDECKQFAIGARAFGRVWPKARERRGYRDGAGRPAQSISALNLALIYTPI